MGKGLSEEEYNALWKEGPGLTLHETYMKHHPQILSDFGDEMEKYWGRRWKANNPAGRLRMVLLHRPGKEFLSVGKPTPWPPHESSLGAWRMSWKPEDLDELVEHHENLVKAYEDEGVEVVVRKPDPNDPPYQVKSIYTADVCFPAVYGQVLLRMYDYIRKGEEVPTFKTLAEIGCPVVGMVLGNGMSEGGPIKWFDEKHVRISVHYARSNTSQAGVWRANEFGHEQYARIVKLQDPEVDVRIGPGFGGGLRVGVPIDLHTSIGNPKRIDPRMLDWVKTEMDWKFIEPPDEACRLRRGMKVGPDVGIILGPKKIMVPANDPVGGSRAAMTKWLESIGVEVVEVKCSTLVRPRNTGGFSCTHGELIRDPEPKG